MKNSALIVALFATSILISLNSVKAQKGMQLGIEGSPQYSWLVNQDDYDSDLYVDRNAFNGAFGITSQFGFTDKLGVGLNVLYSFQGAKYEWKQAKRYKSLQYLKIPLMFTVTLPIGTDAFFTGKIGPQLGVLTSAKLLDKDNNVLKDDFTEAFEYVDGSAVISGGIGYMLADRVCLDVALRYDIGFRDAEDKGYSGNIHEPFDILTPSPASSPRAKTYNMTVGLTIGIRFNLM